MDMRCMLLLSAAKVSGMSNWPFFSSCSQSIAAFRSDKCQQLISASVWLGSKVICFVIFINPEHFSALLTLNC